MLRGEPVLKFVQRLDRREDGGGDGNDFRFHGCSLWTGYRAPNGKDFPLIMALFPGKIILPVFAA